MFKLIAVVSMLIDHIGVAFYPDMILFRVVGRLAFPMFAYQVAVSMKHTRSQSQYINNLFMWAVVAQIPYYLLLNPAGDMVGRLNILFTFALTTLGVYYFQTDALLEGFWRYARWGYLVAVALACELFHCDYGLFGSLFVMVFLFFREVPAVMYLSFVILTVWYTFLSDVWVLICALGSIPFIWAYHEIEGVRVVRYRLAFYLFYPVHLMVLWLVKGAV